MSMESIAGSPGYRQALADAPGSAATKTVGGELNPVAGEYGFAYLALVSSHDSAASGVSLEGSYDDGASWVTIATDSYLAADGFTLFQAPMAAPKVRWRYTNSANVLSTWKGLAFWSQVDMVN